LWDRKQHQQLKEQLQCIYKISGILGSVFGLPVEHFRNEIEYGKV